MQFRYNLKFVSIISPGTLTKIFLLTSNSNFKTKHKKLIVKQSYILLIWITYLRGARSKFNDNQATPSFFIHKKRQSKTTKLKTPMAHKTFSQEQFLVKFYYLSISFKSKQSSVNYPKSLNRSIFTTLTLRKSIPFFTTNLLFLKSIQTSSAASDQLLLTLK